MRRSLALWLPRWPTDRWRRTQRSGAPGNPTRVPPLALIESGPKGVRLFAVDAAATREGLSPGQALAHARALVPAVVTEPADPAADRRALDRLAAWCERTTPWVAEWSVPTVASGNGSLHEYALMLDITGCAHLFGGEAALLGDLVRRLRRFGITCHAAIADTPAAAWAWARFQQPRTTEAAVIAPGAARKTLARLPVAALRLDAEIVAELERLGLRSVGDVIDLPRAPLAARFGKVLVERIAQVLSGGHDPISPRRPLPSWQTRLPFAEPIVHRDGVVIALERLLDPLCALLAREQSGARTMTLTLYRVDCTAQTIGIRTSRAARDPKHLMGLFAEQLDKIDAGFGIETAMLTADRVEPLTGRQLGLGGSTHSHDGDLAAVVDRLTSRLGPDRVTQARVRASHLPERTVASVAAPAATHDDTCDDTWPQRPPRPTTLLPTPEPIEAMALLPDAPPVRFVWRRVAHQVAHAEGPERIDPEWWHTAQAAPPYRRPRDYYRVEDSDGRRYWIFREGLYDGAPCTGALLPAWYMHGLF